MNILPQAQDLRDMGKFLLFAFLLISYCCTAQQDSLDNERLAKMISLSEVVVRSDINVAKFMERVKNDTTFYKAFRTLHIVGYTSLNDISIRDKKGKQQAGLQSRTIQKRKNNCRDRKSVV